MSSLERCTAHRYTARVTRSWADDIELRRIPSICHFLTISVNGLHAIKTREYWKTKSKTKFSSLVLSNVTVPVLSGSSSEAGGHPALASTPATWPGQHNQWRRHSRRKAVGDINKYLLNNYNNIVTSLLCPISRQVCLTFGWSSVVFALWLLIEKKFLKLPKGELMLP